MTDCSGLGEEYILENLMAEVILENAKVKIMTRKRYTGWDMYIGTGIFMPTRAVNRFIPRRCTVDAKLLSGFHTMDVAMAVEDLKEIYKQKQELKRS